MHREGVHRIFVGRREEIKDFEKLLDNIGQGPLILSLYGFGGIGKSTLIRKLREIAKERNFRVLPKSGRVVSKSITSFLVEAFNIPTETKRSIGISRFIGFTEERSYKLEKENVWSRFLHNMKPESVVLVDTTVDVDMEELSAFINFVDVSFIHSEVRNILIVIATREVPSFGGGTYVKVKKLGGLGLSDVKELIKAKGWTWVDPDNVQMLIDKAASGNPKAIELICANQDNWDELINGKLEISHIADIDDFLARIWGRYSEAERNAIGGLSAIALFSPAWDEEVCRCVIDSWYDIRYDLKNKALLEFGKDFRRVTIHDLLRDFAYPRLREKESVHKKLGEYYEREDPVVSLRHYMEGRCFEGIKKVFDNALQILNNLGGFREIFERCSKILSDFEGAIDKELEARLVLTCGGYLKLLRYQDIPKALPYLKRATIAYKRLGNISRYAETLAHVGKVLRFVGNLEESLEALDKAKSIFEENEEERFWHAWTVRQRAHTLRQLGRFEEALAAYETTKSTFLDLKDDQAYAWSVYGIGATLLLLERYEEALGDLLAAKEILKKRTKPGEDVYLVHIAELYRLKGDYETAEVSYREYLEHSKTIQEPKGVADALLGLSEVKRLRENVSIEDYTDSLDLYEEVGCKWGVVSTLIGRALTVGRDSWPKAEKDLRRAEEICKAQSFKPELELIRKIRCERNPEELHPINFP